MTLWITDPKTKEPSVTLSAFVYGGITVLAKLITSGVQFGNLKLADFSGTEFAAAVAALGAIYVARRNLGTPDSGSSDKDSGAA